MSYKYDPVYPGHCFKRKAKLLSTTQHVLLSVFTLKIFQKQKLGVCFPNCVEQYFLAPYMTNGNGLPVIIFIYIKEI